MRAQKKKKRKLQDYTKDHNVGRRLDHGVLAQAFEFEMGLDFSTDSTRRSCRGGKKSDDAVQSLERSNDSSCGNLKKGDTAVHMRLERGKTYKKKDIVSSTSDNIVQSLERGNDARCNGRFKSDDKKKLLVAHGKFLGLQRRGRMLKKDTTAQGLRGLQRRGRILMTKTAEHRLLNHGYKNETMMSTRASSRLKRRARHTTKLNTEDHDVERCLDHGVQVQTHEFTTNRLYFNVNSSLVRKKGFLSCGTVIIA